MSILPVGKIPEGSTGSCNPDDGYEYNSKAERKVRTKIDISVLPMLCLGLIVFQLDRMNVASALTGGFAQDISVDQNTINLGNQMMFLGIIILEIPSNMLLQKIGPRVYIPAQIFVFGVVATLQIFVKNRAGFLSIRLVLGLCEAGYIPGAIYTLSTWYTRPELAKRVAVVFFGMFGGNAISPLLGAGILQLHGQRGLTGWQWIFLIEGVLTILVSILLLLAFPGSPTTRNPQALQGFIRFTDTDRKILTIRNLSENMNHNEKKPSRHRRRTIPLPVVWKTLLHYRRWPHYISTACVFSTWSPLTTYTPSIMMSLGFGRVQANALGAIGAALTLPIVFAFSWASDRTGRRGLCVIIAISSYLTVLIIARAVMPNVNDRWSRFGLWTVVNAFAVCYHPVHNTWVQVNCKSHDERSIAIA
ncbi:hypothetical protein FE257_010851 [Aspergillus nanangensis]|uniref:Major facilitator superfamily (MFS) profile domain-containing protein n=1 Tax=Aspergillus nanangensis TaxID=2582783 RepID=A0AAD4CVL9_ASPNN|nr:hypothetical protein FE257_010851 [Aspergillus nanangensis]